MPRFLAGRELTAEIGRVAGGREPSFAVAFWGTNVRSFLEGTGAECAAMRVVCDLALGGCNPDALVEIGAPNNALIRHLPGMHAKVYLSDRGVIVGSANASNNALGFVADDASLIEAAIYNEPSSSVWRSAANWFEDVFSRAHQVNQAALDTATKLFRPAALKVQAGDRKPGSLLALIEASPDQFGELGFVVATTIADSQEIKAAKRNACANKLASHDFIDRLNEAGTFTNWSKSDLRRWPSTFIEFWITHNRLKIYPRSVVLFDRKAGNVFTKVDRRSVISLMPPDAPPLAEAEIVDEADIKKLQVLGDFVYPTARHLLEALRKLA